MEQESTREIWAKRVERWADSGLSKKDFATEIGVSPHSLSWWKWRLSAEAAGSQPTPRMRRRRAPREERAALTFVEMPGVASSDGLELVLASGIRVRVGRAFDDATLDRLLDVLDRRR